MDLLLLDMSLLKLEGSVACAAACLGYKKERLALKAHRRSSGIEQGYQLPVMILGNARHSCITLVRRRAVSFKDRKLPQVKQVR